MFTKTSFKMKPQNSDFMFTKLSNTYEIGAQSFSRFYLFTYLRYFIMSSYFSQNCGDTAFYKLRSQM